MSDEATAVPERTGKQRYWHLISRFAAASVVATGISQLVFLGSYLLGTSAVVSTVLAWLAGAIPNFTLNRRTWGARSSSSLRGEMLRYGAISVFTAVLAAFATRGAENTATELFAESDAARVGLVWGAFLGTYLVMFVVKFFLVDTLVFTDRRR